MVRGVCGLPRCTPQASAQCVRWCDNTVNCAGVRDERDLKGCIGSCGPWRVVGRGHVLYHMAGTSTLEMILKGAESSRIDSACSAYNSMFSSHLSDEQLSVSNRPDGINICRCRRQKLVQPPENTRLITSLKSSQEVIRAIFWLLDESGRYKTLII